MFLPLKIVFILANSKDPDEMPSYETIWAYTVCQTPFLTVPRMKRVNTNDDLGPAWGKSVFGFRPR